MRKKNILEDKLQHILFVRDNVRWDVCYQKLMDEAEARTVLPEVEDVCFPVRRLTTTDAGFFWVVRATKESLTGGTVPLNHL